MKERKAKCDQCGKEMTIPPANPHKRFCSLKCKNAWHIERRKKAFAALEEKEQQKEQQPQEQQP